MPKITIETVRKVRECRRHSEASWDACIETSETDERSQSAANFAESCDDAYEAAIEALLDDDAKVALNYLETCRDLELEWGDDTPAQDAIAAVNGE